MPEKREKKENHDNQQKSTYPRPHSQNNYDMFFDHFTLALAAQLKA